MANPTTNYGFVLPTSSDLVTDLPADFEVALQGVDTRLKALQPGTTLGDLAYSSATANTNTRLGIGTTGQVLTVTGGVPTWATATAASSGLTLIKRASTTGAVSTGTTFDGVFSASYVNYQIVIERWTSATDDDDALFRFRKSGSDAANGYYSSAQRTNTGTSATNISVAANPIILTDQVGDTARYGPTSMMINVRRNNTSTYEDVIFWNGVSAGTAGTAFVLGAGLNNGDYGADGFRLSTASNMVCTVSVYGLAIA